MNILHPCLCLWQALKKAEGVVEIKRQGAEVLTLRWGSGMAAARCSGTRAAAPQTMWLERKANFTMLWVSGLFPWCFQVDS